LVVAIPMVQPYMYKRFKNIIYFVLLFYILDSAKTYIWFSSPQYRMYLLFEALFVALVLFTFTRPYIETRKMKIGKFGLLLIRMTPVIYGLLLTSVISNILGYTNLTDLTLKIGTQSGVATLIFYGMLMSAEGVSTGLIHRFFNTQESFDYGRKLRIELKALQIIRVGAFILWLLVFLRMVDLLSPVTEFFTDVLVEPHIVGSISFTLGDVLLFVLILSVSFMMTSLISFLFDSSEVSISLIKLPKGVPAAISMVIRYFIIAFGIVLALSSLGIDLSKFNLMAGALGLGIGFGLQTVVSNFISGLILVFERPILVGDTVEVNNLLGKVNRIGVRSSSISTFDGAEVIVPNNNLISNDLINWTLLDNIKRVEILVGTTYGSDPNQVLEILLDTVSKNKDALKDPAPHALFSDFGESSLNFKLRYWVNYEVGLQSKSDISIGIYNQFAKHGIEIPFPQRDVNFKNMPGMMPPKKPISTSTAGKVKKSLKTDSTSKGEDGDQTK
jgi:small-conductance mechanosensitive channel